MSDKVPHPQLSDFGERRLDEVMEACRLTTDDLHWIEIELVGEDERPVPYVAYRLALPDGVDVHGYLDAAGYARIDRLPASGLCRLQFPELDGEAWQLIATLPARDTATSEADFGD